MDVLWRAAIARPGRVVERDSPAFARRYFDRRMVFDAATRRTKESAETSGVEYRDKTRQVASCDRKRDSSLRIIGMTASFVVCMECMIPIDETFPVLSRFQWVGCEKTRERRRKKSANSYGCQVGPFVVTVFDISIRAAAETVSCEQPKTQWDSAGQSRARRTSAGHEKPVMQPV
ncbi:hypothetical protein [Dokdonella sp.]|uniref:hypothetical protein n=1 Tax=Dokdonella sp. TaxID=2291710 RepID=UPI002605ADE0|nr:hypothetical protein [Dokdonella sp.]